MVLKRVLPLCVLIAVLDYAYNWWKLEEKMKMTHQQIKEEHKQMEGDPQLRAARRLRRGAAPPRARRTSLVRLPLTRARLTPP